MGSRLLIAAALVGFTGFTACAGRQPPPAPVRRAELSLTITKSRLRNGLQVVLVHERDATEVQVTMRYQVGAVDDPADQAGVAHLVEHLMYEQVLGSRSLFARLEDRATQFNAFTSYDATTYIARAEVAALEELLSIEAVRLGYRCTTIDDSVFEREREVVINEIGLRDRADELVRSIHGAIYPDAHPYRRSIPGSAASVAAITRDQACAFADAHYTTDNAVLVVSGPITPVELEAALGKFLGKVGFRRGAPHAVVPRVEPAARQLEVEAPISEDALLVAWPLPDDPSLRARVRAVASATVDSIDGAVSGRVVDAELGDASAPMIAVLVSLGEGETVDEVTGEVKEAIAGAPSELEGRGFAEWRELLFNQRKQGAIYDLVADLDDRTSRDIHIAAEIIAGREPGAVIGDEIAGVRTLSRADAAQIVRDHLGVAHATIVALKASESPAEHRKATLRPPVHDVGLRDDPPDPSEAERPLDRKVTAGAAGVTRRTLPNGLEVVLVPSAGAPAMEARMIFDAGTADEPADKRGVALVAGQALNWDIRHLNDLLAFSEAGGAISADVGFDHTSFTVRGLSMHVDYLLAGLRRLVRDGRYDRNARAVVDALRREAKETDDEGRVTDLWRAALFGAEHPYASAGLVRHASPTLTVEDAATYRATHYTPANATLVIAGKFDPVLTDRWIDFLFADWKGGAGPPQRASSRAAIQPTSTAVIADVDQVQLLIALPAAAGERPERLIAAQVLTEIASDLRQQLGATYGVSARYYESRLATFYAIEGAIDANRIGEALALLRGRMEELQLDADARARWFVRARKRVIRQLLATSDSATARGAGAQHEIVLGRDPGAAAETVRAVHDMTIDRMRPTLAELDLAAAAILMTGRADDLDKGFAVLGRTPARIRIDKDDDDAPSAAGAPSSGDRDDDDDDDEDLRPSDLTDALTDQPPPARLALAFTAGYGIVPSLGTRRGVEVTGYNLTGAIGFRLTRTTAVGLRVSLASLDGHYDAGSQTSDDLPIAVLPVAAGAYAQSTLRGRVYINFALSLHGSRITDDELAPSWQVGAGVAVDLGVDLVRLGLHQLGLFARVETQLGAETTVPMFGLGLAYRR